MFLCLVFLYLIGGSMASDNTTVSTGSSSISKSTIMCYIKGHMEDSSSDFVNLEPEDIPCECDVIIYSRFSINRLSIINVDEEFLKSMVALNKPVIAVITRNKEYLDWGTILGPDGNAKETKILCEFAKRTGVSGFLLDGLSPLSNSIPFNDKIVQYIIPYLKQLQSTCDLIIGINVIPFGSVIKNPCMFNFAELNNLVTFYAIHTYGINVCEPMVYNGMTPLSKVEHGANYLLGMEEVATFIKESKISPTKLFYVIEVKPSSTDFSSVTSYSKVCLGEFDCTTHCVQTTKNLYDKGKFAHEQDSGVIIKLLDLDDIKNDCKCCSPFIGFRNIIAGFRGGSQIPCAMFDVQSMQYNIK